MSVHIRCSVSSNVLFCQMAGGLGSHDLISWVPKVQRTKWRGPKVLQPDVGALLIEVGFYSLIYFHRCPMCSSTYSLLVLFISRILGSFWRSVERCGQGSALSGTRFSVVKYHLSASFGHTGLSTDLITSSGFRMFKLIHITQTTMANYRPPGRGEKALVEWFSLLFNF